MKALRPSALDLRGTSGSPRDGPLPAEPVVTEKASGPAVSSMTTSGDSASSAASPHATRLLERADELERAGLAGARPLAIWCGNIPATSNSESAIRVLFGRFGEIRRVFVRRKTNPSRSWCLITYRSSTSVDAALAASIVVKDADGTDVEVTVELPAIKQELSKPKPGALSSVVAMVLDEYQQNPSPRAVDGEAPGASPPTSDGPSTPGTARRQRRAGSMPRRRSAVELEIRNSLAEVETAESCSALKPDQGRTRDMWKQLRTSSFRNKLAVTAMFVQNDDENEKHAKQAIKQTLHDVRQEEVSITTTLKGFAQLYNGEMRGLDYRFKTEASLFRKVMARLDKSTAEVSDGCMMRHSDTALTTPRVNGLRPLYPKQHRLRPRSFSRPSLIFCATLWYFRQDGTLHQFES